MFDANETLEAALVRNVRDALMEDIGRGDWTAHSAKLTKDMRAVVVTA